MREKFPALVDASRFLTDEELYIVLKAILFVKAERGL